MSPRQRFENIDDYFASVPEEVRPILEQVRQTIKAAVPEAVDTIGYQMPAFKRGKVFIFYAAFKSHIGIYPPLAGHPELQAELARYRGPKGNLKFPLDEAIPYKLIGRLAQALADEHFL